MEEKRNKQELIEIYKMYKGFTKLDIAQLSLSSSFITPNGSRQNTTRKIHKNTQG